MPLALVATYHKETLDAVIDLIEVDYTELPPVTSPMEALERTRRLFTPAETFSQEKFVSGDADRAIAESKYVVTKALSCAFYRSRIYGA